MDRTSTKQKQMVRSLARTTAQTKSISSWCYTSQLTPMWRIAHGTTFHGFQTNGEKLKSGRWSSCRDPSERKTQRNRRLRRRAGANSLWSLETQCIYMPIALVVANVYEIAVYLLLRASIFTIETLSESPNNTGILVAILRTQSLRSAERKQNQRNISMLWMDLFEKFHIYFCLLLCEGTSYTARTIELPKVKENTKYILAHMRYSMWDGQKTHKT